MFLLQLQGLCGNFDDDTNNDFNSPRGDIALIKVSDFAEAWKIHDYCPAAEKSPKMCDVHPNRKSWSYKHCNVLKSDLFSKCHTEVPVEPIFERSVPSTCFTPHNLPSTGIQWHATL